MKIARTPKLSPRTQRRPNRSSPSRRRTTRSISFRPDEAAMLTAERVTDTERHVAQITERGYTVVHGVLPREGVAEFLGDTRRLQRELPTVIANSTTVVKGFRRKDQAVPEVVDHDWVRIDNLLLHGERYERLPVHPRLLPVVEGVLGRDCLLSWCMTSNQLPGAVAQRMHCDDEMYPL